MSPALILSVWCFLAAGALCAQAIGYRRENAARARQLRRLKALLKRDHAAHYEIVNRIIRNARFRGEEEVP